MQVKCPQCGRAVEWRQDNPNRPFCSPRCKSIDLGEWAAENRYIAGEPTEHPEASHPENTEKNNLN
ncbi:MAG: DNA gyrase inhibitor YacG [Methylohalobius sp. ZOD2]|nr:DNA gyrase inhibitor YacG [Methylothermaceae bacterium]